MPSSARQSHEQTKRPTPLRKSISAGSMASKCWSMLIILTRGPCEIHDLPWDLVHESSLLPQDDGSGHRRLAATPRNTGCRQNGWWAVWPMRDSRLSADWAAGSMRRPIAVHWPPADGRWPCWERVVEHEPPEHKGLAEEVDLARARC